MYLPNDDTQNYPFCRLQLVVGLDTQRNVPTDHNLIWVPEIELKNFGD